MSAVFTWIVGKVSGISLQVWGYVAAIGGVLLLLLKIFDAGKEQAKTEADEKTLDNVVTKNEVDNDVRTAGGDAARSDLMQNYSRD